MVWEEERFATRQKTESATPAHEQQQHFFFFLSAVSGAKAKTWKKSTLFSRFDFFFSFEIPPSAAQGAAKSRIARMQKMESGIPDLRHSKTLTTLASLSTQWQAMRQLGESTN